MAHGGPIGDPRLAVDLSTVQVWQRRLAAGIPPLAPEQKSLRRLRSQSTCEVDQRCVYYR
eukprot:6382326-Amphidinium_carterae.1